jgi:nucleoside-diphosphate-sugar epimerase
VPIMSFDNPTLPKGSLVLVTGVTGFIASHTAEQLLEDGYNVRGTTRRKSSADWLYERFEKKFCKDRFNVVEVADMKVDGAFDDAVKGMSLRP